MYLSSSSPILFWPRIGERKLGRSARWNMFLKPTIISFRMSRWTSKTPKNWARNEPIHVILLLHLPWLFQFRIDGRKLSRSARRNMFLKPMMISFRMSRWTLKTPKNWARTNLYKVPTWLMMWQSSWFSDGAVMDSWWPQLRYRCISLQSVTQCGYLPWAQWRQVVGASQDDVHWIVTWVTWIIIGHMHLS